MKSSRLRLIEEYSAPAILCLSLSSECLKKVCKEANTAADIDRKPVIIFHSMSGLLLRVLKIVVATIVDVITIGTPSWICLFDSIWSLGNELWLYGAI
nr:hypothetical protein [Maribacter polysiphoniae]